MKFILTCNSGKTYEDIKEEYEVLFDTEREIKVFTITELGVSKGCLVHVVEFDCFERLMECLGHLKQSVEIRTSLPDNGFDFPVMNILD